MEKTPSGTAVGVDNPYEHAGVCDHLTDEGRCRYAFEKPTADPAFTSERRADDYRCPVAEKDPTWRECPHYRFTQRNRECERCGLEERRMAHHADRPLLEEHHLSYPESPTTHEITIFLCRWCHSKVHKSWARITDDVRPDPEALAEKEARRSRELDELEFETAADRFRNSEADSG